MLRKALLVGVVLQSLTPFAQANCDFLEMLSPYQTTVAYQAYRAGQPHEMGLTTVAIAWEESKLGKYKVRYGNGKDVSVGVMHSAVYWKTQGMSAFARGVWVEDMITDDAKSIQIGVEDLLKWKRINKNNYRGMINSYNAGYGSNIKYVESVISTVKILKGCDF